MFPFWSPDNKIDRLFRGGQAEADGMSPAGPATTLADASAGAWWNLEPRMGSSSSRRPFTAGCIRSPASGGVVRRLPVLTQERRRSGFRVFSRTAGISFTCLELVDRISGPSGSVRWTRQAKTRFFWPRRQQCDVRAGTACSAGHDAGLQGHSMHSVWRLPEKKYLWPSHLLSAGILSNHGSFSVSANGVLGV